MRGGCPGKVQVPAAAPQRPAVRSYRSIQEPHARDKKSPRKGGKGDGHTEEMLRALHNERTTSGGGDTGKLPSHTTCKAAAYRTQGQVSLQENIPPDNSPKFHLHALHIPP